MHFLITGGCGFIGSHLADALIAARHEVTVLDDLSTGKRENLPPSARLITADVANKLVVEGLMEGMDGCFHLAAIASVERCEREPERARAVNVDGLDHVLAASNGTIPVVYASSAAVYGDNPNLPLRESEAPAPLSVYGQHKLENEIASAKHAAPTIGLRFFNCYGPRQDPRSPYSGVISIFTRQLLARESITLFGTGQQTRDFIYVGDVVEHLQAAMTHLISTRTSHVLNVCTGKQTSLLQLLDTLIRLTCHATKPKFAEARRGDIMHSAGNPAMAMRTLEVQAHTDLEKGLSSLLLWMEHQV